MGAPTEDSGRQFEERALALARAIYDPLGFQGSRLILGRERDGVFIGEEAINAFEFTTVRTKDKAVKDGHKLAELLKHLLAEPQNRYKTATGWFVTSEEPTADQREAIAGISRALDVTIHSLSVTSLRRKLCDVEGYLAARALAPFGSVQYTGIQGTAAVDSRVYTEAGEGLGVRELSDALGRGERLVLTGEFGVGKSHTLRELHGAMRKRFFRKPATAPFPLHINLRECAGLRSPAEVLRRHAEEIGFDGDRGLISAWRAGACVLLLDGFDEVIPSRWLGSASNLRQVRW